MLPRSAAGQERQPERERQSNGMPIKPNPLFRELLPKNARVYVLAVHLVHERAISRNERTLLRPLSRATKRLPSCAPVLTRTRTFFLQLLAGTLPKNGSALRAKAPTGPVGELTGELPADMQQSKQPAASAISGGAPDGHGAGGAISRAAPKTLRRWRRRR